MYSPAILQCPNLTTFFLTIFFCDRSYGGWSEEGLTTITRFGTRSVVCSTRHLTSFAVLVDVTGQSPVVSPYQQHTDMALSISSVLFCSSIYSCFPCVDSWISLQSGLLRWVCHFPALPHCYYHFPTYPEVSILYRATLCEQGNKVVLVAITTFYIL